MIWEMDRRQIEQDLVRWYAAEVKEAAETDVRPGAFEVGFGPVPRFGSTADPSDLSTDAPLVLRAGKRQLLLQGKIDRVDWDDAKTHFRVIDYKTGKTKLGKDATFDKGRALQLPIYLHAASAAIGIGAEHGESQYFYVSSAGGFTRKIITGDDLAAARGTLEQILGTIVDGVDGGFFAANPGAKGRSNCTFCEVKDLCDANIDRVAARKSGDARGESYRALEDIR